MKLVRDRQMLNAILNKHWTTIDNHGYRKDNSFVIFILMVGVAAAPGQCEHPFLNNVITVNINP
jgi:hypothetical protein